MNTLRLEPPLQNSPSPGALLLCAAPPSPSPRQCLLPPLRFEICLHDHHIRTHTHQHAPPGAACTKHTSVRRSGLVCGAPVSPTTHCLLPSGSPPCSLSAHIKYIATHTARRSLLHIITSTRVAPSGAKQLGRARALAAHPRPPSWQRRTTMSHPRPPAIIGASASPHHQLGQRRASWSHISDHEVFSPRTPRLEFRPQLLQYGYHHPPPS